MMVKIVCVLLALTFNLIPFLVSAQQVTFNIPFALKQKHGDGLLITAVTIDQDENGDTIYIYETIDGKEGFVTQSNIANFVEFDSALYPSKKEALAKQQDPTNSNND